MQTRAMMDPVYPIYLYIFINLFINDNLKIDKADKIPVCPTPQTGNKSSFSAVYTRCEWQLDGAVRVSSQLWPQT